jgi:transposase-like protein
MDEEQSDPGQKLGTAQTTDGDPDRTPEQVRLEIEQTRAELGDTVAALAEKTDVKGQARHAVDEAKQNVAGKAAEVKETVTAKKEEFVSTAREATPDSAIDARQKVGGTLRSNPVPVAALAAFAAGVLVGRRST